MAHIYMIVKEMWSTCDKLWDIVDEPVYVGNDESVWEKVSQLNRDLKTLRIEQLRQGLSIYEDSLNKLKAQKEIYEAFTPEQKALVPRSNYDQRILDCEADVFRMGQSINNLTDRPYYSDTDVGHRYTVTRIELAEVSSVTQSSFKLI